MENGNKHAIVWLMVFPVPHQKLEMIVIATTLWSNRAIV